MLQHSYIEGSRPSPLDLVRRIGPLRLGDLLATRPFTSLWNALGQFFPAVELRQLFGRYATYVGASPFSAPATLMLIAHVEQLGVWTLPGGMISLAEELQRLAEGHGARFHFHADVEEIAVNRGAVDHLVYCQEGERLRQSARRVVFGETAQPSPRPASAPEFAGRGAHGGVPSPPKRPGLDGPDPPQRLSPQPSHGVLWPRLSRRVRCDL